MASLWETPSASTPFAPSRINAQFTRQVHSRVPVSGTQFVSGRTCQFAFKSTPSDLVHLPSSRLVAKLKVTQGDGTTALVHSVRLQSDPLSALFSQAKYSVNGVVISSVGANYSDLSNIAHRLSDTVEGSSTIGSAAMIGFQKDMHPTANVGGVTASAAAASGTVLRADLLQPGLNMCKRNRVNDTNPKQQILVVNGANAFELSAPVCLPYWTSQPKAMGQNLDHLLELTIAQDFKKQMLYSEDVHPQPSHNTCTIAAKVSDQITVAGNGDGAAAADLKTDEAAGVTFSLSTAAVAKLDNANINASGATGISVVVEEIYLSLCCIQPRAPIPRPLSTQYSWTDVTMLTRSMQNADVHTEVFTVPISSRQFFVSLRVASSSLNVDRELYNGGREWRQFSLQRGSSIMPLPAYNLDPTKLVVGRALDDYNRTLGATAINAKGGRDILSWCDEPCLLFTSTTEEASTQVTLRFNTQSTGMGTAGYEILLACFHTKVAEFTVDQSGVPTSTVTDELIT